MRKIIFIIGAALFMLITVQSIGGYLVDQLSAYNEAAPVPELAEETKVIKYKVLRLEPTEYYSIQMGSYSDTVQGQETINKMAELGYRVYVSDGPPYKLWLGCSAEELTLPQELTGYGQDVHIEKQMLNTVSLRFEEDNQLFAESISSLLSSYDVVLKHSLEMFEDGSYGQHSKEMWQQMTAQIDSELQLLINSIETLLEDPDSEQVAGDFIDLQNETAEYQQSLQLLLNKENDKAVFLAQSYLLEVIDKYHTIMVKYST